MVDTLSIPFVRTILESITDFESFEDINAYLHLIHSYSKEDLDLSLKIIPKIKIDRYTKWIFEYVIKDNEHVISGRVIPKGDDGIFLGLERQYKYSYIFEEFAFQRKNHSFSKHLAPIILDYNEVPFHIHNTLAKIEEGKFNFIYLKEGEYLRRQVQIIETAIEECTKRFQKQEIKSLLDLCGLRSEQIYSINQEGISNHQPPIEFTQEYNRYQKLRQQFESNFILYE